MPISIHAPQWGATSHGFRFEVNPYDFNPRTPVGCDVLSSVAVSPVRGFQSTHPSGVRPTPAVHQSLPLIFQSTHPSGVRPTVPFASLASNQFQSTHPSGVRPTPAVHQSLPLIFQSTHPSGVRPTVPFASLASNQFQSTHPSGVRRGVSRVAWCRRYFNPRTPVGCDLTLLFSLTVI